MDLAAAHLPHQALIDAYGKGGFRFAGLSHRGSLLCLPDGIWAWPVEAVTAITRQDLAPVLARADLLDFFLIGTGDQPWPVPPDLRAPFRAKGISLDAMPTAAATRTYNVLLMEKRRVGAALIAVD